MKAYLRILCFLMSGALLFTMLTACGGGVTEAPTEEPTEAPTGTTPVTDPSEETQPPVDEPEVDLPVFQTGELTLTSPADLFPDFKEEESFAHQPAERIEIYGEAEQFKESTMPYAHILAEEFGGGRIIHTPCEYPAKGWDHT